jgi:hypothetical protein
VKGKGLKGIAAPSARNDFPYRHCEAWNAEAISSLYLPRGWFTLLGTTRKGSRYRRLPTCSSQGIIIKRLLEVGMASGAAEGEGSNLSSRRNDVSLGRN